jgi:undecaprenyl-diphosphatase
LSLLLSARHRIYKAIRGGKLAIRRRGKLAKMPIEQIIVLALIQGITEFLPISSSGHLILVPVLTGWRDQGLITDVMVHMGSFIAVLIYFWRDVLALLGGFFNLLRGKITSQGKLALIIIAATLPAVVLGVIFKKTGLMDHFRSAELVAWNAIVFGVLLYAADAFGSMHKSMQDMRLGPALLVGVAQALAIIPGTSRSGITISAQRLMGFSRPEAARFSFLLGLPAIAGSGVLVLGEALENGTPITGDAVLTGVLTIFTAILAIAFLMAVLRRFSLLWFAIYRLLLGTVLLVLIYSGYQLGAVS